MMRRISPSEPITEIRRIPIQESGEPLVDFLEQCPLIRLDRPFFAYTRVTLVRQSLISMLNVAAAKLPPGYHMALVEGWRPPHVQRRMYLGTWKRFQSRHPDWSDTKLKRVVNRFTAPLGSKVPPPHSTGGAVDIFLVDANGRPHDHCSPYDAFDPLSFPQFVDGLSEKASATRSILRDALHDTGLTNYPSEYWHWSYGDQGWAYRGGHPFAIYGPVLPEGYVAPPEDDNDEPFQILEDRYR